MARFGDFDTVRDIALGGLGGVYIARRVDSESGEDRYAVKVFQPPVYMLDEERIEQDSVLFLEGAQVQRLAAESGSAFWAPVHGAERCEGGAWYATDLFDRSVEKLVLFRKDLEGPELQRLVESVVIGLSDLLEGQGRPHGNIKPTNVLIAGRRDLTGARIVLTDPAPTARVRPEEDARKDLKDLGDLIHQSVLHRPMRSATAWPLPMSPEWQRLGRSGEGWLKLCNRLLDPTGKSDVTLEELVEMLPGGAPAAPLTGRSGSRAGSGAGSKGEFGAGGSVKTDPRIKEEESRREEARRAQEAERRRQAEEAEQARRAEEAERRRRAEEAERARQAEEAERKRLAEEAERARRAEEAEKRRLASQAERDRLAEEAERARQGGPEELVRSGRGAGVGLKSAPPEEALEELSEGPAVVEEPAPVREPAAVREPEPVEAAAEFVEPAIDGKRPWIKWAAVGGGVVVVVVGILVYLLLPKFPTQPDFDAQKTVVADAAAAWQEADDRFKGLDATNEAKEREELLGLVQPMKATADSLEELDLNTTTRDVFEKSKEDAVASVKKVREFLERSIDPKVAAAIDAATGRAQPAAAAARQKKQDWDRARDGSKAGQIEAIAGRIDVLAGELLAMKRPGTQHRDIEPKISALDAAIGEAVAFKGPGPGSGLTVALAAARAAADRADAAVNAAFPDQEAEKQGVSDKAGQLRQRMQKASDAPSAQIAEELTTASGELEGLTKALEAKTKQIKDGPAPGVPAEWATKLADAMTRIGALAKRPQPPPSLPELNSGHSELDAVIKAGLPKGDTKRAESIRAEFGSGLEALLAKIADAEKPGPDPNAPRAAAVLAATEMTKELDEGRFPAEGAAAKIAAGRGDPGVDALERRLKAMAEDAKITDAARLLDKLKSYSESNTGVAAESLQVWGILADQSAWPKSPEDLVAAKGAVEQIGRVVGRITNASRRGELKAAVDAQAKALWKRHAEGADPANDAAMSAARGEMSGFGASLADLSGKVRFNWLLYDFKADLKSLKPESDADAIKKSAARFVTEAGALDEATRNLPAVGAALKAASDLASAQAGGGTVDFKKLGPGTRGWEPKAATKHGIPTVTYTSGGLEIEFAAIDAGSASAYLSTTEVSLAMFLAAVDGAGNPALWDEIRKADLLPVTLDSAAPDPREGPHGWDWLPKDSKPTLSRPGGVAGFDEGGGWLVLVTDMRNKPSYPPELADKVPPPSEQVPMQHVSAASAALVSGLIGCRLPTSAEWLSALAVEERVAKAAGDESKPNCRDNMWAIQKVYCADLASKSRAVKPVVWPDDGAFRPFGGGTIKIRGNATQVTEENDGVLWFAPVDSGGGVLFKHLIGNVAEFLWDGPAGEVRSAAETEQVVSAGVTKAGGEKLKVIGASALAAPEIFARARTPLPCPVAKQAYSDVGFRLAFSTPPGGGADALASKAAEVGRLSFLTP